MIRVKVNGEEQVFEDDRFKNFKELYDYVKPPGRVLSKLVINDTEIPISRVSELYESYFEGGETIEIEFISLREATKNLIKSGREHIVKTKPMLSKVAQQLLLDEKEGFETVAVMMDALSLLDEMRDGISKAFGLTLEELGLEEESSKLLEILRSLSDAMKRRDVVTLSDIVEEKLIDVYDFYLKFFDKVERFLSEEVS